MLADSSDHRRLAQVAAEERGGRLRHEAGDRSMLTTRLSRIPRVALCHLPTPLEPLPRLTEALGGPRLHVKRDDCTGLAAGGNKARKLEFILAEALAQGADTLVTIGARQSNHVRQTAAAAAKRGLSCEAILVDRVRYVSPRYESSGNALLTPLLGANVTRVPADAGGEALLRRADEVRAQGRAPYVVPMGGSNALGALGYVSCALELSVQAREAGVRLDHVVVASASAGTQAGLLVGLSSVAEGARVHGISVYDADVQRQRERVRSLAEETAELLGIEAVARDAVVVEGGYLGEDYGLPTEAMREAVRLVARSEGLLLDPVYTGKAMAGLIGLIRAGAFSPHEHVVFLHTGGLPGLFAYEEAL